MTVSSSYYEARYSEAAEAAAGSVTFSLIEKILLALGVTCTSMADLYQVTGRVNAANPYYNMTQEEIDAIGSMCYSDTIDFSIVGWRSAWDKLKAKVKALISDKDVSKKTINQSVAETIDVEYHNGLLSKEQIFSLFGNTPVRGYKSSTREYIDASAIKLPAGCFYGVQALQVSRSGGNVRVTVAYVRSKYDWIMRGYYVQQTDSGCQLCSKSDGSLLTWRSYDTPILDSISFEKPYADSEYVECTVDDDNTVQWGQTASGMTYGIGNCASFDFSGDEDTSFGRAVYALNGVYDSFDDYVLSNTAIKDFPLTGDIVGDAGAALDDTQSITVPAGSVTTTVENFVIDNPGVTADELNEYVGGLIPSITDVSDKVDDVTGEVTAGNTWLEKIFNKVNSSMDVTMSSVRNAVVAVGATSGDILDETKKTSSKLSTVSSWLPGLIMEGIFQVWNSAEQRAFREELFIKLNQIINILNSIAGKDFSPVVNVAPPLVNVPEPKVNVTVPAPEVNVTVPAPQVVVDNKTDLSGISSLLSSILSALIGIKTKVDTIPGKMDTLIDAVKVPDNIVVPAPQVTVDNKTDLSGVEKSLSSIFSVLTAIQKKLDVVPEKIDILVDAVNALPEKISEPVINVTTEVPDVIVPEIEIPEITISETQVTNTVKQVFLIDADRVHMDADRLLKGYSSHFPDLKVLLAIILLFSFPSEVEYPVFEISTPEILKDYVGSDSIILLDCEDYSIYFSWTRNLIRAFIWIYFVYSIFGHFKVRFTVS